MPAPQWFLDALATLPEHAETESDGVPIHYRRWGSTDRPGLVLVHGGAAHSGWWDHVAPLLAGEYCVVALDLSGHGDSGRRDHYDMETWAREVIAVAEHACLPEPPIIVAHSMGGWVGLTVAADHGDDLAGLILLDSMVERADPEVEAARVGVAFGPLRIYPTLDAALARFRTVPDQPTSLPYVNRPRRARVVATVAGGWTWKFDPRIFERRPFRTATRCAASGAASRCSVPSTDWCRSTSARTCTNSSAGSRRSSRSRSRGTTSCSTSRSRSSPASARSLPTGNTRRLTAGTRHGSSRHAAWVQAPVPITRRIARPLLAGMFISGGIDALLHPDQRHRVPRP